MKAQVALHQVGHVFLFRDGLFCDPAGPIPGNALFRVEVEVAPAVFLLADTPLNAWTVGVEVGLHHLHRDRAVTLLQLCAVRHMDEVLPLGRRRGALAYDAADLGDGTVDLLFKIHRIVDHIEPGVGAPGPQSPVVHQPGLLHALVAGGIAEVIGVLRPLGAGHQMQHRVIAGENLLLGFAEVGQGLLELPVCDVGLVVQQRPVVDNQDLVIGYHLRRLQRQLFLVKLVFNDEILELLHTHAVGERPDAEAGDQVCGCLRDGDHLPAVLWLELLQYPADQRGFSGGGAARKHDSGYAFCQNSHPLPIFLPWYSIILPLFRLIFNRILL